ncbi:MAG: hypothetical protein ABI617_06400, partial [Sphingomicrobium sp.]
MLTVAAVPMHVASAQTAPATAPNRAQTAAPRDPMAPLPDARATIAPAPVVEAPPAPPPVWQIGDARALLAYTATVGSEGLD